MRGVTEKAATPTFSGAFQLTRLMRGVTKTPAYDGTLINVFQLTRLMRGVTFFSHFLTPSVI